MFSNQGGAGADPLSAQLADERDRVFDALWTELQVVAKSLGNMEGRCVQHIFVNITVSISV